MGMRFSVKKSQVFQKGVNLWWDLKHDTRNMYMGIEWMRQLNWCAIVSSELQARNVNDKFTFKQTKCKPFCHHKAHGKFDSWKHGYDFQVLLFIFIGNVTSTTPILITQPKVCDSSQFCMKLSFTFSSSAKSLEFLLAFTID